MHSHRRRAARTRDIIEKFCQHYGGIELTTFVDPVKGLEAIRQTHPQIVFLDIEMENLSGLDIAASLPEGTCFIFTTAYLKYTLDGFNLDAADYLHKPFAYSRFQTALAKALRRTGQQQIVTAPQCIVVKQGYNNVSIPVDDILYIEAMMGYSKIFRATGGHTTSRVILKNLFAMLPQQGVSPHPPLLRGVEIENTQFQQAGSCAFQRHHPPSRPSVRRCPPLQPQPVRRGEERGQAEISVHEISISP